MIYLDSSAIVKLIKPEPESRMLANWLNERNEAPVTSVLAEVEVPRALRRSAPARLAVMPVSSPESSGSRWTPPSVPPPAPTSSTPSASLDAVHLATAEVLAASGKVVSAFVTYDTRQAAAVEPIGIPVAMPGRG